MEGDPVNPKQIVAWGYDRIAERYAEWTGGGDDEPRERYLALLENRLSPARRYWSSDAAPAPRPRSGSRRDSP